MDAKKCDRCGKLYEQYNHKYSIATIDTSNFNGFKLVREQFDGECYGSTKIDLCPECADNLKDWLGQKEVKK